MSHLVIRELGTERIVPLATEETAIGRSRGNLVKLMDEQSSRNHCKIVRTDKGYSLLDNGSSNGTYVNGARVDKHVLQNGDAIAIGQALLVFREGDPVPSPAPVAEGATQGIPIQDRSVQILLETVIQSGRTENVEEFLRIAVDNVVQITHAERGVLFAREGGGELKPRVARDGSKKDLGELVGISRSIPLQVWESRKAIYLLDTESQKDEIPSESVSIYHLRTVMCAPLRVGEKILGVLYVDSRAKAREYTATDLSLFEAVADYLALAMENLRAAEESKRSQEEHRRRLEHENAVLRSALEKRRHLIGECPEMKSVYETLRKVAPTDATVLVLGESGTGKEAIAHAIHDLSPRSAKPFVVIDCAAIPETLLESELFGYEKGAFTGAVSQKQGKMEAADGGTLFLDEIGELSPALQAKLLRALEQKTVSRVGGVEPVRVDLRLVTATNRDLEALVKEGKFRQDLLFRLKVVSLRLPPLRDRGEDILLLAKFFLDEANSTNGRSVHDFSEEAKEAMRRHRWDGNVRELKHRIEQGVILTNHEYLSTEDLNLSSETGYFRSLEVARDIFEKSYIVKALERHSHNVTHTAKSLGISRQHLQNLIKKHAVAKASDGGEDEPER